MNDEPVVESPSEAVLSALPIPKKTRWPVFVAIAVLVIGFVVIQVQQYEIGVNGRQDTRRTACESLNRYRQEDLQRWQFLLHLSTPPRTSANRKIYDEFVLYINHIDAQLTCPSSD